MQVILLEKIRNLGDLGDLVTIKPGYGRNYLLPFGKAVRATKANIADFNARRTVLEKAAADKLKVAQQRANQLAEKKITIQARAAEEGKLYGSLGVREIVNAMKNAGQVVEKSEVTLPEGPIRYVGEHLVVLQLHPEVEFSMTITVEEEK